MTGALTAIMPWGRGLAIPNLAIMGTDRLQGEGENTLSQKQQCVTVTWLLNVYIDQAL